MRRLEERSSPILVVAKRSFWSFGIAFCDLGCVRFVISTASSTYRNPASSIIYEVYLLQYTTTCTVNT
jgi:hypothetical protein